MRTIKFAKAGGPEVLEFLEAEVPPPAPTEVRIKVKAIGMVNLIAGERIVPELIQDDCTPENVSREVLSLLTDAARFEATRAALKDVRQKLGAPGASGRAAEAVLAMI